jgi:hypothetical protein
MSNVKNHLKEISVDKSPSERVYAMLDAEIDSIKLVGIEPDEVVLIISIKNMHYLGDHDYLVTSHPTFELKYRYKGYRVESDIYADDSRVYSWFV